MGSRLEALSHGVLDRLDLVAVGDVRRDILRRIASGVREVLGCEVKVLEKRGLPQESCHASRGQYSASEILDAVKPAPRKGARLRTLAVVDEDLFSAGLNFVFGEADLSGPAAVVSLTRLANEFYGLPPDEPLLVERAVKEAVHEVGHMLGLTHCRDRGCVMYFSNSLVDTDRKADTCCEKCRRHLSQGRDR
ncbi:MAG: archaemetzincin family Zn-dependent metalloprotease [Planctomycetes bacterium]|nr:archaemetzincin family Zn-dependent metalloprotease [Planctomycetota bacterium]